MPATNNRETPTAHQYEGAGPTAGFLLLNLVFGVFVPILVSLLSKDDPPRLTESFILGLAIFCALTSAELGLGLQALRSLRRGEVELWQVRHELDTQVQNIRVNLHDVRSAEGDHFPLFIPYYSQELKRLHDQLSETVTSSRVTMNNHHIDTAPIVMRVFEDPAHSEFRATISCHDGGTTFDPTFRVYFEAWANHLKDGRVDSLRRMFIYTADDELQQGGPGHTYRLAAWHNYAAKRLSGLEAKAVKKDVLLQYLRSHGLPASRLDIGIYSSVYVYTGDQRTDELVTGTFCRDPAVVKNYTAVFDQLWTSHQTLPIQRFVKTSLKTEQLFDFDIEPSDPVEEVHAT